MVFSPVRLKQDTVDLLEIEGGLEAVNGLANGAVGQELDQDLPEQRGAESVAAAGTIVFNVAPQAAVPQRFFRVQSR
jgi:hypothetical protein